MHKSQKVSKVPKISFDKGKIGSICKKLLIKFLDASLLHWALSKTDVEIYILRYLHYILSWNLCEISNMRLTFWCMKCEAQILYSVQTQGIVTSATVATLTMRIGGVKRFYCTRKNISGSKRGWKCRIKIWVTAT